MQIQPMKLYENTWVVDDNGVRIFILAGKEKALIIDTGMSGLPVRDIARQAADLPLMLLNTHADGDHTGGNDAFDEFYMHPSEAIVYHKIQKGKGRMLPVFDGDLIDLGQGAEVPDRRRPDPGRRRYLYVRPSQRYGGLYCRTRKTVAAGKGI